MKFRWVIILIALAAASAFALSVQGGRWWSVEGVEIGPFGSRHCFGGECRPAGLEWIGGGARWIRFGIATWAAGLLTVLTLVILAGGIAAKRVPRLAAKTVLVSVGTATLAAGGFLAQGPNLAGVNLDRGVWIFGVGVVLAIGAAVAVLRTPRVAT